MEKLRCRLRPWMAFIAGMNALGTAGIFVLMALIVVDVTMRSIIGRPLVGIPEMVRLGIVSIVFLQGAHTLAEGRFTSTTVFLDALARRSPTASKALKSLFALVGTALFAFVAIGASDQIGYAWRSGEFIGSLGIFTLPTWPMHAVVFVGSVALAVQFAISALLVWDDAANAPRALDTESEISR